MSETATLSGAQKVAVVLMNLRGDQAAQVMKQFTEPEAEEIASELVRMRRVDPEVAEQTLAEFHQLARQGGWNPRGGRDFAAGLLEASFGAERAADVMSRVANSMAGRSFEFLDAAEASQVATLLDGELPQTIALILAHLRPERASAVLAGFVDPLRSDVAQCIATMGSSTPETVGLVADTLKGRAGTVVSAREVVEVVGGVQPLVEIINRSDVAVERAVLEGLEERDPELAEEVRSRMLVFTDIVKLDPRDVQQVLRGIDVSVLALAMKGTTDQVTATIQENLSERNRELLDDERGSLGPVRMSQVEESRAAIVRIIRDLEAQGVITVQRGEEDEYVE